jgi:hypothetical protein
MSRTRKGFRVEGPVDSAYRRPARAGGAARAAQQSIQKTRRIDGFLS